MKRLFLICPSSCRPPEPGEKAEIYLDYKSLTGSRFGEKSRWYWRRIRRRKLLENPRRGLRAPWGLRARA